MPRPLTADLDAQPYAAPNEIELVNPCVFMRTWVLATADPLADVLTDGYLDSVYERGFERFDRIEVTCSKESEQPEHALLVIDGVKGLPNTVALSVLRAPQEAVAAKAKKAA